MRTVRYEVAASLDGFIAGPDGEFDWIPDDPDIDFGALMARFDTLLMGRRTWEIVRAQPESPAMPGVETWVFSRTLRPEDCPGARLSATPETVVPELKAAPGKEIWLFGGGELFRCLLGLGLVDAVEVAVVPVLLGEGLPLLPGPAPRTRLRLVGQRGYPKSGIQRLEYAVEGPIQAPPRSA